MNTIVAVLCLAVASTSASWSGYEAHAWNAAAHIPSGSIAVGHNGAVIAGPSGSVQTDNGLHGHGASARLSGPAGDVGTHGRLARLAGPGLGHYGHGAVAYAAPVAHAAPLAPIAYAAPVAHHAYVAAPAAHATIVGPSSHATIVAPSAHAAVYSHHGW